MSSSIKLVHEDRAIIILSKPAGLHSIDNEKSDNNSVARELIAQCAEQRAASEKPGDGGLIHRLDYGTSGLMIAAKTREIWQKLREDITQCTIEKRYIAVVSGKVTEQRELKNYIGSRYRRGKKVTVYEKRDDNPRAQIAHSLMTPITSRGDVTAVAVELVTGVRHQIRAQAAAIGHPLVGDELYGSTTTLETIGISERGYLLHAYKLSFMHPLTGEKRQFSELPEELSDWNLAQHLAL